MGQGRRHLLLGLYLTLALGCLGSAVGLLAAPALSRMNHVVQVAERVYAEETTGLAEDDLQLLAFHISGVPRRQLFAEAWEIQGKFRVGSALFGLWCGLVAGLKITSILTQRRCREYEADASHCVACGRCYLSCPVERKRLRSQG